MAQDTAEPIAQDELDAARPKVRELARADQPRGGRPLAKLAQATAETQAALLQAFPAERIVATLEEMMTATTSVSRGRGEQATIIEVPDHRTRIEGTKLMLAYALGKPIERMEVVNVNLDPDAALGLKERLANSPALRRALRQALEESENAAAIEVEVGDGSK